MCDLELSHYLHVDRAEEGGSDDFVGTFDMKEIIRYCEKPTPRVMSATLKKVLLDRLGEETHSLF
ncbi:hypothetical protein RchiOBHm_Chr3g0477601 [Rosa chinensis]|uniref:Uncharacterized protein n=1 Tax=Rosa chinensis TaxID=74649 RepID=A0A2P6RCZ6_ROSCH|nr:hypothetical protein RchiOBHm_Chr3g0477601 [Rosa chinensis]